MLKTREEVFLALHMLLGGVWSCDYGLGDLADFQEGKDNVRVYQIKEVVQPQEIEFPLEEIRKHVRLTEPGEETIQADDDGVRKETVVIGEAAHIC